ncbi:MAG: response regulator [Roseburia sp.]|nr:response regulator [Roseburia sp.]
MRYVLAKELKPGMTLAQKLVDPNGRVLAGENSKLSEYAIEKLIRDGYDGVYIVDALSADIVIEGPIRNDLRVAGMGCVQQQDVNACKKVADQIVESLWGKQQIALDLTDFRTTEDYIYAHSVNVAVLSCLVGLGFGLGEEEMRNLVFAALIHDLGKLQIPSIIRNKAGRLSREEFQIMKSHAMLSYELIKDRVDISAHVKKAVRSHHENVDGSGYPDGTMGEEQSLFTKIIHVADVYDALISRSPYKKPYSPQEATEYLMGGCGILFDKEVVMTLLKYVPMYPKGTDVVLSDGRMGIISENTGVHNLRPVVRLYDGTLLDLSEPEFFNMTIQIKNVQKISEEYENERKEMLGEIVRPRILVVDDMRSNLQMMQDMLGEEYDLVLAKSGQQAISYIDKKDAPDLILMDIDMPGMDGIETARRIGLKTGGKRIPLVFVTSLCDRETVMKCRELKPESYIVRPYKPVYVKTEIKRILEGWGR